MIRAKPIVVSGWLAFVALGYPGQFTHDSVDQLTEARAGFLTDAHPPLMSFLWRYIDMLIPGTLGMFVLQTAMLVAGLFLLFRRFTTERTAAMGAIALLWFPPISAPMMVIWKDSLMAGACMLGFALFLEERRRWRIAGLALVGIGVALRYNGLALAAPLIVLVFEWPARRRYLIAVGLWLAIAVANLQINHLLTDRKMHFWTSTLAVMDVAGTICYDSRRYSDAELEQLFAGTELLVHEGIEAQLCQRFARTTHSRLIHGDGRLWDMNDGGATPTPARQRAAMQRVWGDVVLSNPRAYAAYRLSVFWRILSPFAPPWGMVTPAIPQVVRNRPEQVRALGLREHATTAHSGWIAMASWLAKATPLFRPWLYLVLAVVLLAVSRRRITVALLLSGISMQLSLLIAGLSPDYRYAHWLVLAVCAAAVLIVTERVASRRRG